MNISALGSRVVAAAALAIVFSGCAEEVQHGLTEKDANEIRVVLGANGISSSKKPDPVQAGLWEITVPAGQVGRATEILVANHLPPDHQPGLSETFKDPGLVPTATEEKARMLAAIQGELAKTLESVDGVLMARVNVNVPETSDLEDRSKRTPPSAAVVVTYRRLTDENDKPPFTDAQIKRLVAHAVPDLTPENVEVVLTQANLPGAHAPGEQFVDIAGMRMTLESKGTFQALAAAAVLSVLMLAAWIGLLYYQRGSAAPQVRSRSRAAPEA